uniref:AAA+ ATPase domain-containing protein n=1 Tax=Chromera velia CCMP2878 TaxID=1169474 RepID=A0A0G4G760_9ALVE|eukprot:Cvel_20537.t1-p1 / transcript=Cvel_20537.t1 / gene=Cvel_20537 / organism=Chromera_velia_CCMP2878 / gene_product=Probable mitochondrial chaperone BCS1-B, putative / transcript_product=Probable mitochondrial chaperone BCS1-B, putative / location=Cvel_scaffold1852:19025-32912(-) / protein_length=1173 / sequence_SO=supercontig / SO=protein_coding / is_pseudo=false
MFLSSRDGPAFRISSVNKRCVSTLPRVQSATHFARAETGERRRRGRQDSLPAPLTSVEAAVVSAAARDSVRTLKDLVRKRVSPEKGIWRRVLPSTLEVLPTLSGTSLAEVMKALAENPEGIPPFGAGIVSASVMDRIATERSLARGMNASEKAQCLFSSVWLETPESHHRDGAAVLVSGLVADLEEADGRDARNALFAVVAEWRRLVRNREKERGTESESEGSTQTRVDVLREAADLFLSAAVSASPLFSGGAVPHAVAAEAAATRGAVHGEAVESACRFVCAAGQAFDLFFPRKERIVEESEEEREKPQGGQEREKPLSGEEKEFEGTAERMRLENEPEGTPGSELQLEREFQQLMRSILPAVDIARAAGLSGAVLALEGLHSARMGDSSWAAGVEDSALDLINRRDIESRELIRAMRTMRIAGALTGPLSAPLFRLAADRYDGMTALDRWECQRSLDAAIRECARCAGVSAAFPPVKDSEEMQEGRFIVWKAPRRQTVPESAFAVLLGKTGTDSESEAARRSFSNPSLPHFLVSLARQRVMICMLIPLIIQVVFRGNQSEAIFAFLKKYFKPLGNSYVRTISYQTGGRYRWYWGGGNNDDETGADRNNILQKAIRLYIQETLKPNFTSAECSLVQMKSMAQETDNWGDSRFSGSAKQLAAYVVNRLPAEDTWVLIDKKRHIWFKQYMDSQEEGGGNNVQTVKTKVYELKASGSSAKANVDAFIEEAFSWYKELKASEVDTSRYLYQMLVQKKKIAADKDDEEAGKIQARPYKRYVLSDAKTFGSLFFPEKEPLLSLIDDFTQKKGKFAIEGFPDKLGLLLDGPPGTGKTSLIKCLAHYTKRHVVAVPLEKIKTNQELMDIMFDLVFAVDNEEEPIKMNFKDIIFVMEDVDCASDVVYARAGAKERYGQAAASAAPRRPKLTGPEESAAGKEEEKGELEERLLSNRVMRNISLTSGGHEKEDRQVSGGVQKSLSEDMNKAMGELGLNVNVKVPPEDKDKEKEVELREEAARQAEQEAEELKQQLLQQLQEKQQGEGGGVAEKGKTPLLALLEEPEPDKLNLSGLLNVLDGVIDAPGRILVMTSNHPEKLDPALIRPGRINKRLHLGYLCGSSMASMLGHYLQVEVTGDIERKCAEITSRHNITPAQMEQSCAEVQSSDELFKMLEDTFAGLH